MVHLDSEELHLVPGVDLGGAAAKEGNDALEALLEGGKAFLLNLSEGAFCDDVTDLEVVVAVDEDDETAVVDVAESVFGVGWLASEAQPENIDRNSFLDHRKVAGDTRDGMAAVAADGEMSRDFDWAVRGVSADTGGYAVFLEEAGGLPAHAKGKRGKTGCLRGEEVEKVPLGHEGDEFGVGGEVGEVRDLKALAADDGRESGNLRVTDGEEFFEEAKLVHQLKSGWMNGVATEVAEEVLIFFEDGDGDTPAREKVAEHDAGGASADDAAGGLGELFSGGVHLG